MSSSEYNKPLRILIVEDEAIIAEDLKFSLQDLGYRIAGICDNYEDAIQAMTLQSPDLVILDIIIKGVKDGIELAMNIRQEHQVPIIFLTSHSDKSTVNRATEVKPNGYLVKPFEAHDLYAAIETAIANFEMDTGQTSENKLNVDELIFKDFFFIRDNYVFIKIAFSDTLFVKSAGNYIEIHTTTQQYLVRKSLKEVMQLLPDGQFFKVNRFYIINLQHIVAIHPSVLELANEKIPISKELREELLSLLKKI